MNKGKSLYSFISITLIILLSLSLITCDKNMCENCYPSVFECKVDGKTWKTSCESMDFFGCTALDVQLYNNAIYIDASNDKESQTIEIIVLGSDLRVGDNKLYKNQSVKTAFNKGNNEINCVEYEVDTFKINSFNITKLDTINQILQASFEFTGKNDCGDEVKITSGKLDVIYRN